MNATPKEKEEEEEGEDEELTEEEKAEREKKRKLEDAKSNIIFDSISKSQCVPISVVNKLIKLLHHSNSDFDSIKRKFSLFHLIIDELKCISQVQKVEFKNIQMIDITDLIYFSMKFPFVFRPLFHTQAAFRRKIMGEKFWRMRDECTWTPPPNFNASRFPWILDIDDDEARHMSYKDSKTLSGRQLLHAELENALDNEQSHIEGFEISFSTSLIELERMTCANCETALTSNIKSNGICEKCIIPIRRYLASIIGYKHTEVLFDISKNHKGDNADSEVFVSNFKNEKGEWKHPLEPWDVNEEFREGFDEESGKPFWYSVRTGLRTWIHPQNFDPDY